ncbi:hypothetical protein C8Q76DRAFT_791562 [Earliella scabrosa]|nr:hypothetical protein C8Q76DRAFT_791562 [Earliella scabrosa]
MPAKTRVPDPSGDVVTLNNRHRRLPKVWRTAYHSQLDHVKDLLRNVYIVLVDTSPKAMESSFDFAEDMTFPDGTEAAIQAAGWLSMGPGDALECLDDTHIKELEEARDLLIGDEEDIGPEKAKWDGSKFVGGIAWERSYHAASLEEALAHTLWRSLTKSSEISPKLRHKIIKAVAPVGIRALEFGPKHISAALKTQAELVSLPRVGSADNYAFPTMQLNIASARPADALANEAFRKDLGQFAGKHIDFRDNPGGITTMISMHKLAADEDPGYFMIAELGVAIEQHGLVMTCFSGLLHHGSFPPTARPGKAPSPKSVRFAPILYLSQAVMDGASMIAFSKTANNRVFNLTPEMLHPSHDGVAPSHTVANWLSDGPWLSNCEGYLQTVYQGFATTLEYFARQIPSAVKFQIDHSILQQAFSLADEQGNRIQPREWSLHPSADVKQTEVRRQAFKDWEAHKAKMCKFIPHMAVTEGGDKSSKHVVFAKRGRPDSGRRRAHNVEHSSDSSQSDGNVSAKRQRRRRDGSSETPVEIDNFTGSRRKRKRTAPTDSDYDAADMDARPPKKRSRKKKKVRDGDDSEYSDQRPAPPAKSSKRPRRKHRKVPPVVKSHTSLFIRSDIRFLDDYCAADRFAPKFVQQVAGMWIAFDVREHSLDVLDLKVAVERRRLMLTNAAAWLWLTNDCVRAIRLYLEDKPEDAIIDDEPDGWLQRLTRQIYIWRVRDEIGKIDPHQYLSNDHRDAPSVTIPRPQGRPHSSVTDWVVEQVIRVVRVWTRFPTNTRLLAAHFVCHIIRLFRNSDVLLLPHMWRMHQNIKTEVLNAGNIRHTLLTVAMLSPVIHALSNHPLAATDSPESVLMEKISKLVEVCMPRVRDLGIQMFMSLDVLDPERLSLPPISLAPTRPLISAGVGKGMDALLKFVRKLLPLVVSP